MQIIKSFRKTLSMKIDEAGNLIVKAPFFTSQKSIEGFIAKHKNWIDEKKASVLDKIKTYTEGEKFLYFGEEYELKFEGDSKKVEFDGMNFYLNKNYKEEASNLFADFYKEEASNLFADFYKKEAKKYIEKRLYEIAEKNNLKFNNLKITSAKTRWGSCTSTKNINFSYRLIMAPIKTIDYVIVHELAHLKHMNHSKKFWDYVSEMMSGLYPGDYKIHKKWLLDHGNKLIF